jgi:hypothetical protein
LACIGVTGDDSLLAAGDGEGRSPIGVDVGECLSVMNAAIFVWRVAVTLGLVD